MPTRLLLGEGRVGREGIDMRTCPICRGIGHGTLEKVVRVIEGDPPESEVATSTPRIGGGLGRGSDRVIVLSRSGNAGGGKGPDFWSAFDDGEVRVIGDGP